MVPPNLPPTLDEIVRRLRDALNPRCIYLFGSHAEGTADPQSDVDLLVVVDESRERAGELGAVAYRVVSGIGVPLDILVYSRADFEKRSTWPVSLERTVRDEGKIIYAA